MSRAFGSGKEPRAAGRPEVPGLECDNRPRPTSSRCLPSERPSLFCAAHFGHISPGFEGQGERGPDTPLPPDDPLTDFGPPDREVEDRGGLSSHVLYPPP